MCHKRSKLDVLTSSTVVSLRLFIQMVQDQQRIYMYVPIYFEATWVIADYSKALCVGIPSTSTSSCKRAGVHDLEMDRVRGEIFGVLVPVRVLNAQGGFSNAM